MKNKKFLKIPCARNIGRKYNLLINDIYDFATECNTTLILCWQLFEFADKYRGKYDSSITVAQKYYGSVSGYNVQNAAFISNQKIFQN